MNITAKVKLQNEEDNGDYSRLVFSPDYDDGRNAAWSHYTPSLHLDIVVRAEVAAHFQVGKAYTLTFTQED